MKKIILLLVLTSIYLGSFAQSVSRPIRTDSDKDKMDEKSTKDDETDKNCAITMANGKMMMIMDGKTVIMDRQMTTQNGNIVMLDGTVKMKDGKTVKLKNGDCVDLSGKMIMVKNHQIEKNPQTDTE